MGGVRWNQWDDMLADAIAHWSLGKGRPHFEHVSGPLLQSVVTVPRSIEACCKRMERKLNKHYRDDI